MLIEIDTHTNYNQYSINHTYTHPLTHYMMNSKKVTVHYIPFDVLAERFRAISNNNFALFIFPL